MKKLYFALLVSFAIGCSSDDTGNSATSGLEIAHTRFVPRNLDSRPCVTTHEQFSDEYGLNVREFWMMRNTEHSAFDGFHLRVHYTGNNVSGTYQMSDHPAAGTAYLVVDYKSYDNAYAEIGSVVIQDLGNDRYRIEFPETLQVYSVFGGPDQYSAGGFYEGSFVETPHPNHF